MLGQSGGRDFQYCCRDLEQDMQELVRRPVLFEGRYPMSKPDTHNSERAGIFDR